MSNVIMRCSYGTIEVKEDGTYIYKREVDGVEFDISNGWKGDRKGVSVTYNTRNRVIDIARRKAQSYGSDALKIFLEWYDNSKPDGEIPSDETQPQQAGASFDSSVLEGILAEMKKQTEVLGSEARLDRVLNEKTMVIAEKLTSIVDEYIRKEYGNIPKKIEVQTPKATATIDGPIHKDFESILQLVNLKIPTLLVGPAGCGKNFILEKCAESLGLNFYFTNAVTQEYKLTGFIDANGVYQETQFYKAFKDGGIFFLDEMDASIPEALIILNAAIANGYFDFPNGKITAHPDFRVVAAANTMGHGADTMYVGRSQLDAATLDRFITFKMDYDPILERTKCLDNELYAFIIELRRVVEKLRLRFTVSTRMMINSYKMLVNGLDKKLIMNVAILKGMTIDDIRQVKGEIQINNEWTKILNDIVYGG